MSRLPAASSRWRSRSLIPCAVIKTVGVSGNDLARSRFVLDREAPRFESRLHDLVVHELPVNRDRARFVNPVDHRERIAHPEAHSHHIRSNHTHAASFRWPGRRQTTI